MSYQSVYEDIKNKVLKTRKDVLVNPGTVISDTFITPSAYIVNKQIILLNYAEAMQTLYTIQLLLSTPAALQEIATVELKSVSDVEAEISAYLDKFADNFNITRESAVKSSGNIYYARKNPLDNNITINSGSKVKTLDGKEYQVLSTITWTAPGTNNFDDDTASYILEVPVEAMNAGITGNTVAGTITKFVTTIPGITAVYNKYDFDNGLDAEDDTSLIARIKTKLAGHNFGTQVGYENLILNQFPDVVKDVLVVMSGDSIMLRDNGYGGVVDIYVLVEEQPISIQETPSAYNYRTPSGFYGVLPTNQPIEGLDTGNVADTVLIKDSGTLTGSYAEKTYITWYPTTYTVPPTIKYTYYKTIAEIQSFLQLPENAILGNTIKKAHAVEDIALVKRATRIDIDISARIVISSGYDVGKVISDVETNIRNYILTLKLNDDLAQSDIVNIIENTAGVNYVVLPFSVFYYTGSVDPITGLPLSNLLTSEKSEYIRLNSLTIAI